MQRNETTEATLRAVLVDVLGLPAMQVAEMTPETPLFGALPEMDSMAVATLLTAFEDRLGIVIDDDDIEIETFEHFGTLLQLLEQKVIG